MSRGKSCPTSPSWMARSRRSQISPNSSRYFQKFTPVVRLVDPCINPCASRWQTWMVLWVLCLANGGAGEKASQRCPFEKHLPSTLSCCSPDTRSDFWILDQGLLRKFGLGWVKKPYLPDQTRLWSFCWCLVQRRARLLILILVTLSPGHGERKFRQRERL